MKPIECPSFGAHAILVKKSISSLSGVIVPPNIRMLNVDGNLITDFLGFNPPPNFETLIISNNPITSLKGMPEIPKLLSITVSDTPFTKNTFYRVALIILFGSTLRVIDGERVSQAQRDIAATYPRRTADLLRAGWNITFPPPDPKNIPRIMATLAPPTITPKRYPRGRPTRLPKSPPTPRRAESSESMDLEEQEREIERLQLEILALQEENGSA
jgi:hypothetical protein